MTPCWCNHSKTWSSRCRRTVPTNTMAIRADMAMTLRLILALPDVISADVIDTVLVDLTLRCTRIAC